MSLNWVTVEIDDLKFQFYQFADDPKKACDYMDRLIHALEFGGRPKVTSGTIGSDEVE